jgi:hypothetical protein
MDIFIQVNFKLITTNGFFKMELLNRQINKIAGT